MKHWHVAVLVVCLTLSGLVAYAAGSFTNRDAVVEWISSHPGDMATLLEQNLSQAQLDALEAKAVPDISTYTDEEKIVILNLIRDFALDQGVPEGNSIITAIDDVISGLEE